MVKEIETVRWGVVRALPALAWIIGTVITLSAGCGGEEFTQIPAPSEDGGDAAQDVKNEGAGGNKPDAQVDAGDASDAPKLDADAATDGDADANCPADQKLCSGKCVAKDDPLTGCSATSCEPCAVPHAVAMCADAGACAIGTCDEGFQDCDKDNANGCEGNLQNDPKNCGSCGHECPGDTGTPVCEAGVCAVSDCIQGKGDCDDDKSNGCEVDLTTSLEHCGFCSNPCAIPYATDKCVNSVCEVDVCEQGLGNCDGEHGDGCETDLTTTVEHCGACDKPCTVGDHAAPTCVNSTCTAKCDSPHADCNEDPADGCEIDTSTDSLHCSGCNKPCVMANGTAVCSASACAIGLCNTSFGDCNNDPADGCETDLLSTAAHCTGCDKPCPVPANATASCTEGVCGYTCIGTWTDCDQDPANGCEFDIANDPNNCGGCGAPCTILNAVAGCSNKQCVIAACNDGFLDCNPQIDGCEVDGLTSDLHCGQCNHPCVLENAAGDCVQGSCQFVCAHPFEDCSGPIDSCSTNTDTDTQHCGTCGAPCNHANATEVCELGACRITGCTGTWRDCNEELPDGCESDILSDPANCAGCKKPCSYPNAAPQCLNGTCAMGDCLGTYEDCDKTAGNGCEADLMASLQHCGGCYQPCALAHAAETCNSGTCTMGACESGWHDCDNNPATGCEANWSSDPYNCGACGHDCLGGTCTNGNCDPFILANLQSTPWSIAVDATHVYWTNRPGSGGSVQRVPIAGGAVQILAPDQNDPDGLAVNNSNVYWANVKGGTVNMTLKAGGGAITQVAGGQQTPNGVAATDQIVVWSNWGTSTAAGSIWKANANGTGAAVVTTQVSVQPANPHRVATNGTHIWWANWGNGRVRRIGVGGGTIDDVATGQSAPLNVVVDATYAFWTNDGDGRVMRADATGAGGITPMATAQSKPSGLALSATHVYFTASDLGVVRRMLKNGATVETLATGQQAPTYMAVDATAVYWTNATGGTVMKLALP